MLRGCVDLFRDNKIHGWAFNVATPDEHLQIVVKNGEEVVAEGVANIFRKDLPVAGAGKGDHSFVVPLPFDSMSLKDLTVVAVSQTDGNTVLSVETDYDPHMNRLSLAIAQRYDAVIFSLGDAVSRADDRARIAEEATRTALNDLTIRNKEWEERAEAIEVYLLRIDEMLKTIIADQNKRKKKRFLGMF